MRWMGWRALFERLAGWVALLAPTAHRRHHRAALRFRGAHHRRVHLGDRRHQPLQRPARSAAGRRARRRWSRGRACSTARRSSSRPRTSRSRCSRPQGRSCGRRPAAARSRGRSCGRRQHLRRRAAAPLGRVSQEAILTPELRADVASTDDRRLALPVRATAGRRGAPTPASSSGSNLDVGGCDATSSSWSTTSPTPRASGLRAADARARRPCAGRPHRGGHLRRGAAGGAARCRSRPRPASASPPASWMCACRSTGTT